MGPTAVLRKLKNIVMSIYQDNVPAETFAKTRIQRHYAIKNLGARGVETAEVRPTGWHGEGGKSGDNNTGHLTVDFKDQHGGHVTTHHIYKDDSHYSS